MQKLRCYLQIQMLRSLRCRPTLAAQTPTSATSRIAIAIGSTGQTASQSSNPYRLSNQEVI